MELTPAQLEEEGYEEIAQLEHEELIPFVLKAIKDRNVITYSFWILNGLLVFLMLLFFVVLVPQTIGLLRAILHLGLGAFLSFLLVPLHELTHGLMYKLAGAPAVQYTANWKKLYFTAQADMFVVDARSFYYIAFAPCLLILLLCGISIFLLPLSYLFIVMGIASMHTLNCIGDFAMVSFFYRHRRQHLVTYDDFENQRTYFFSKATGN